MEHQYGHDEGDGQQSHAEHGAQRGGADCQIARSSAKWSHNINTEVRTFDNVNCFPLLIILALDSKRILRNHQE
jgi:phospholipase D1/2